MAVVAVGAWLLLSALVLAAWPRLNQQRAWRAAALLLTLAFSVAHQLVFRGLSGEAQVAFRYAENLAQGNGPVFNAGERVEGYTNFAWVVLLAWPRTLFGADVADTAVVLGMLATCGAVLLAYFLVNSIVRLAASDTAETLPALGVAGAILTAAASGLAAYGASGSETPLFLLLTLGLCTALVRRRPLVAGVLIAAGIMTRPDGILVGIVALVWLLFAAGRGRVTWWAPAGCGLGALVLLVPWVGWRVTYYGWFTPNKTAVRAHPAPAEQLSAGWEYLTGFVVAHQAFLLLGVAAVAAIVHRRKDGEAPDGEARAALWLLFTVALVYLVAVTLRGGDPQPAWRLLAGVPVLFSVGAVAAYGARLLSQGIPSPRPRSRVRVVASVTVVMTGLSLLVSTTQERMLPAVRDWSARTAELAEMGSWLGERLPAGAVVSTYVNGALAYHAGIRIAVVDVRGRTDEHIARQGDRAEQSPDRLVASDYDYVVNVRRPAVAVAAEGYDGRQHCAADPAYAGRYNVATFQREGTARWATLYLRREQVSGLVAALDADPRFTYVPCPL